MYQTHPRTKGSTGFPDQIKDSEQLRSSFHLGAGWKAMNTDLSSPRLGDRGFKTVDDLNNWGFHKRLIGEVDVFQLDSTHELYGHMNVNYLRLPALPSFDHWADALAAVAKGDYFTTTGEVLLPRASMQANLEEITAKVCGELDVSPSNGGDCVGRRAGDAPADDSAGGHQGIRPTRVYLASEGARMEVGSSCVVGHCRQRRLYHSNLEELTCTSFV